MSYLGHMTIQPIEGTGAWFEFGLHDRMRKAREATGLSRAAFANVTGIARNTVLNYEHGKTKPNAIYLRTWADATGADLGWLKTGEPPNRDGECAARDSNPEPADYVPHLYLLPTG